MASRLFTGVAFTPKNIIITMVKSTNIVFAYLNVEFVVEFKTVN